VYFFLGKHSHLEERQSSLASLPLPKHIMDENAARRRAMSESGQQKPKELTDYFQHKPETTSNYDETVSKSLASLNSSLDSSTETKTQLKENTQCECSKNDQHFPTIVMDTVYNTSLETMYSLLFNSSFMSKFLNEIEKSTGTIGFCTLTMFLIFL
jgi:hypothetical protein